MSKYNLIQSAIVAAAVALFVPALCAPMEGGENPTSIISAFVSALALKVKSTPSKRGVSTSFVDLGMGDLYQGAIIQKYPDEVGRQTIQWRTSRTRFTIVNETPEILWIWIETTLSKPPSQPIFSVPDPDAPGGPGPHKIKIARGQSIQISNIPTHCGINRAYARCDENGQQCAGHEGAATKWEWSTEPGPDEKPNTIGINLSLGT
jgi:hypothetical protein